MKLKIVPSTTRVTPFRNGYTDRKYHFAMVRTHGFLCISMSRLSFT